MQPSLLKKIKRAEKIVRRKSPCAILFSGGLDSSVLVGLAKEIGVDMMAIFFSGNHITDHEIERARNFLNHRKIKGVEIPFDPLSLNEISLNLRSRCYICKRHIISVSREQVGERTLMEGSHNDDLKGFRPGIKALQEMGVISPWLEVGITKQEIKEIGRTLNIPIQDFAPRSCLLTRFPYDHHISREELNKVKKMEDLLFSHHMKNFRIRRMGKEWIIQVGEEERGLFEDIKQQVLRGIRELGIGDKISWFLTQNPSGFFDSVYTQGGGQ